MSWNDQLHRQYLEALDERDEAIEKADRAFQKGFLFGLCVSLVFAIFLTLIL